MTMMPRVFEEQPKSVAFTVTTQTLGIHVTKSSMSGKFTIAEIEGMFTERLQWAYDFEKTIERNMPRICKQYKDIKTNLAEGRKDEWDRTEQITKWEKGFNLFFKVFMQYKSSKKQKLKDRKHAFVVALLSLDDIELWERQHKENIYTVSDLILWYNEHIDPFSAILINPEIAGEIT